MNILPEVRQAGQVAGHLQQGLEHIPAGTPVLVAMGDMQCGVLSALQNSSDASKQWLKGVASLPVHLHWLPWETCSVVSCECFRTPVMQVSKD